MAGFEPNGVITLTTDFGTRDGYVGAMKGVILERFPAANIVDIAHDVPPHNLRAGAQVLANACSLFPPGTVHVAVVDPGVGSTRAAVVAQHEGQVYVTPDNGLLSHLVPASTQAWRIEKRELTRDKVSRTFHGRDVFAPVGAVLAAGKVAPEDVGGPLQLQRLPEPELRRMPGRVVGEIVGIDRFGNLVTNIPLEALGSDMPLSGVRVVAGDVRVQGIAWSYADVSVGDWLAVIGSRDTVEISLREDDAAARSGLRTGDRVEVISSLSRSR